MKQIFLTASALILMSAMTTQAQTPATQVNPNYENYIQVTGNAEKEVVPDEIYIRIEINENDTKGKVTVEKLEQDMIAKLKSIGVDIEKDLLIDGMDSELKKFWLKKNQARTSASYQLKVNSAAMMGKTYQALESIGIANMSVIRTDHSKIKELTNEIRMEAIKDAKAVASSLAEAIGQKAGRAIYIVDYNNSIRPIMARGAYFSKSADMAIEESAYYESPLDFHKIKLTYSITAKFELE